MENEITNTEEIEEFRAQAAREVFDGEERAVESDSYELEAEQLSEDAVTEVEPESAGEPDPLAEVKDTLNALSNRLSALDAIADRLRKQETVTGNIVNSLKQKTEKQAKQEMPTKEELEEASKSDEALNALKEDYPGIEKVLEKLRPTIPEIPDYNSLNNKIETSLEKVKGEAVREVHVNLVKAKHPDFWEKSGSQEYRDWLMTQPAEIFEKAKSNNALDAIAVLDKFDEFFSKKSTSRTSNIKSNRQKRLESHATKPNSLGKSPKNKATADMSEEEYRRHIAKEIWEN